MITSPHGFPALDVGRQGLANQSPVQEVETFNQDKVKELNCIVQYVLLGSQAMVDFLQYDRDLAREAGVESLCVEISAILEGDKFDRVVDAIGEAVQNNTAVTLSRRGLARVRRMESLLAEVQKNIGRFTPSGILAQFTQERRADVPQVGQRWAPVLRNDLGALGQEKSTGTFPVGYLILVGAIALTLIVYAATTHGK
jgi:hypothetical protein